MKIEIIGVAAFWGAMIFTSCDKLQKTSADLKTENDKVSYSLGVMMGNNLKKSGVDTINEVALAAAISDVYSSGELKVSEDSAKQILDAYFEKLREQKKQKSQDEAKSFLEENKKKEGVMVLPSGLQYQIVKEGNGPKPALNDQVTVHYTGKLLNGTVFDSSVERNEPATFPVSGVIPGWTEALQLMPVGSKWNLFIPSELAYGERGAGGSIPPNSTLIFEVELLAIAAE
jgi:FKBP-type peptidyl-prolyl cis-trans isomerase FklB